MTDRDERRVRDRRVLLLLALGVSVIFNPGPDGFMFAEIVPPQNAFNSLDENAFGTGVAAGVDAQAEAPCERAHEPTRRAASRRRQDLPRVHDHVPHVRAHVVSGLVRGVGEPPRVRLARGVPRVLVGAPPTAHGRVDPLISVDGHGASGGNTSSACAGIETDNPTHDREVGYLRICVRVMPSRAYR